MLVLQTKPKLQNNYRVRSQISLALSPFFKNLTKSFKAFKINLLNIARMPTEQKSTNWSAFALIALFILLIVGLVFYLGFKPKTKKEDAKKATDQKQVVVPEEASISISSTKFNPESISVKKGTLVTWVNDDSAIHHPAADPHPTHDQSGNIGEGDVLAKGETFSYTFEKEGTYTYHDNLNPLKLKGTVIVTK